MSDIVIQYQINREFWYFAGGESMTGVKFYLQAKLHGMRRFSGISVFGTQYSRPNYRLQRNKNWISFFESESAANDVKAKLENRYPQVVFKVKKDNHYGNTGYGFN